jgi:hypothetical protein
MAEQDTGKFRINTKDQYYTTSTVAGKCVAQILELYPESRDYVWVEPSAGNGAFLNQVPANTSKIGIDIEPKTAGIQQCDFLEWTPPHDQETGKKLFFGNPPFGRQGSLAKAFIKHAAKYADIIAFILPRSFVKPSMSRAFPLDFHPVSSIEIERNAFQVNGDEYDVPCVFQIWEKRATNRVLPEPAKERGFSYVKINEPFDIAFTRAGGRAGVCYKAGSKEFNVQCFYFIRLDRNKETDTDTVEKIINRINSHKFPDNTVGPRSLSKPEANEVLNRILDEC